MTDNTDTVASHQIQPLVASFATFDTGTNQSSSGQSSTNTREILIGLYTGIGLLGVLANIALLVTACSHARLMRRSATGGTVGSGGVYIHYGVAGFDLAFLLVNLPMQLVNYLYYDSWAVERVVLGDAFDLEEDFASASCKAFHYIPSVVYGAHVLFLVGLGIDRLLVAVFPLGAAARHPAGLMLVNAIGSVALALVMALPQLVVSGTRVHRIELIADENNTFDLTYRCGNLWSNTSDLGSRELAFQIYVQAAYVWLPILAVQFCYMALLLHLGRRDAAIGVMKIAENKNTKGNRQGNTAGNGNYDGNNKNSKVIFGGRRARNLRLNLTVGLTTAVFFASWAPFSIANLVSTASDPLREFLRLFGYSSAAVNTGVYAFLNPAQRAHLQRLIVGFTETIQSLTIGLKLHLASMICSCLGDENLESVVEESRSAPPQLPRIVSLGCGVGGSDEISQGELAGQKSGSSTFKQQMQQQLQLQAAQERQDQQQQKRKMRRDTRSTRVGAPGGGTVDR